MKFDAEALYLEKMCSYISTWKHNRSFTSLDTIVREFGVSSSEARKAVSVCCKVGLGKRVNTTSKGCGGISWIRSETSQFMNGAQQ